MLGISTRSEMEMTCDSQGSLEKQTKPHPFLNPLCEATQRALVASRSDSFHLKIEDGAGSVSSEGSGNLGLRSISVPKAKRRDQQKPKGFL